jgi:hypothetical protein
VTLAEESACLKSSRQGAKAWLKSKGWKVGLVGGRACLGETHSSLVNSGRLDFRGAREDSGSDKGRSMDARNVWSSCFKRVTFFFHFSLLIF